MNVLQLNTADIRGGAARAAYRLHEALRRNGVSSRMLVQRKASTDPSVYGPEAAFETVYSRLSGKVDKLPLGLYRQRSAVPYHLQWVPNPLLSRVREIDPDVIHLHWIANGFVRVGRLAQVDRPIVWTMHDMWPFTGGCHYSADCERYEASCGACPQLGSSRARDLSRWTWRRKRKAWQDLDLTVVAPSRWLAECARVSSLFGDRRIEVIPNPIDTDLFKPLDQQVARDVLNLPQDKRLILFGAIGGTRDPRKGYAHLQQAFTLLGQTNIADEVELAIFGASAPHAPSPFAFPTHYMGQIHDDPTLALLYNAADVFVLPSEQDNLPNTIMEAMACGTPCVGFNVGGVPDMVDHQANGFVARPYDAGDLAEGLQWCLERDGRHRKLSQAARADVLENFAFDLVAARYMGLYDDVCSESSK